MDRFSTWVSAAAVLGFLLVPNPVRPGENRSGRRVSPAGLSESHVMPTDEIPVLGRPSLLIPGRPAMRTAVGTASIPEHSGKAADPADSTRSQTNPAVDVPDTRLFPPVSSLRVTGASSSPPERPDGLFGESLERPEDRSGPYEQTRIPKPYTIMGRGITRAPRNTHPFTARPLYFEDASLERCGQSRGLFTPAGSTVHFATRVLGLPLLVLKHHPDEQVRMLPDCPVHHRFACRSSCPYRTDVR